VYITQYYTADIPARQGIAEASRPDGYQHHQRHVVGFRTTGVTAITIGLACWPSNWSSHSGLGSWVASLAPPSHHGHAHDLRLRLATRHLRPITDNAGGIAGVQPR